MSAAILIGGQARRLHGRFKPLLPVGGRSILLRQIEALGRAGIQHIALVGRWLVEERPPRPVFADAVEGAGALGALYTALLVADGDGAIVLAGDMPFVEPALLQELSQLGQEEDAVIPETREGLQPLCACYRRSLALPFKAAIDRGELRIRDAVERVRVRRLAAAEVLAIDRDGTMLMNVNTAADYERARLAARHRP